MVLVIQSWPSYLVISTQISHTDRSIYVFMPVLFTRFSFFIRPFSNDLSWEMQPFLRLWVSQWSNNTRLTDQFLQQCLSTVQFLLTKCHTCEIFKESTFRIQCEHALFLLLPNKNHVKKADYDRAMPKHITTKGETYQLFRPDKK